MHKCNGAVSSFYIEWCRVHVLQEYLAHLISLTECSREVVYVCKQNLTRNVQNL